MNQTGKHFLKNAGGFLLGALVVSPLFLLPYIYTTLYNLGLYITGFVYFYSAWKKDYYVNYSTLFRLSAVLILLQVLSITLYYNVYGLGRLPRLIFSEVESVTTGIVALYGLYIWIWHKPRSKKTWAEFTNAELLRQYVAHARVWGEGSNSSVDETEKIDAEIAYVWSAYFEIKKRSKVDMLRRLLKNKYEGVRALAARHLLGTDEQEALRVLHELQTGNSEIAKLVGSLIEDWNAKKVSPDAEIFNKAVRASE